MAKQTLERLPQMTAEELVKALKRHFDSARELVRRARELERGRKSDTGG